MMDLTLPTITTNIAALISDGIVEELEDDRPSDAGTLGRKAKPVDVVSGSRYFIGVEIAPNRCVFCVTDLRLRDLHTLEEYRSNADYDEMIEYVARRVKELTSQYGAVKICGIGVGVPGFVDRRTGTIRSMGRFGWKNKPLAEDLHRRTGLPVCVENNVRVRVIGEDLLNGRIRPETFAYFFVSLGIACPLMIKNSLFSGQSAGAGEIGHMIMQVGGPKCDVCGNDGCLDAIASESTILKLCKSAMDMGRAETLSSIVEETGRLTMHEVLKAQQCNDLMVRSIVKQAVQYLAIALSNVINFMSPNLVIVDAYVMKLTENREMFSQIVKQNMYGLNDSEVQIEFKEYDAFGGCKGAAAFAIRQFFIREI
jgi:predicted NBD/HSP70 family sugar kinase